MGRIDRHDGNDLLWHHLGLVSLWALSNYTFTLRKNLLAFATFRQSILRP
jgi:hypothetical protein